MQRENDLDEEIVGSSSGDEAMFDQIVGHIEDIIMEPEFQELQKDFFDKYCTVFEDKEENKLEYTTIFNHYTELIESYIEQRLIERLPQFSMVSFLEEMKARSSELDGEIFEMLLSFTDFLTFKEILLDHKAVKEGHSVDFSSDIIITSLENTLSNRSKLS
ncbi:ADP-ribosylation factor-like protein 2-binding protein isoform X2 [Limulus polyphemus]|nr:ADP-ribosylation factor-like protein 2-binding protein isoform X2 [Limulus polyphemus]